MMETICKPDDQVGHFDVYIEELQEYFAHRKMRYGAAEDLPAFVDALSAPGTFGEDVGSLLRSMLFREHGSVTPADLVKIVIEAVAGHDLDQAAGGYRDQIGQTLKFVSGVLRTRNGVRPEETSAASPEAMVATTETAPPKRDLEALRAPGVVPWSAYVDSEVSEEEATAHRAAVVTEVPLFRSNGKTSAGRRRVYALAFGLPLLAIAVGATVWYENGGFRRTKDLSTTPVVTPYYPSTPTVAKPTPYGAAVQRPVPFPEKGASSGYNRSLRPNRSAVPTDEGPEGERDPAEMESPVSNSPVPTQAPAPIYRVRPAMPYQGEEGAGQSASPISDRSRGHMADHPATRPAAFRTSPTYGYRGSGISVLSSGTMAGNLVSAPAPKYPTFANMMGSEGRVVIQAVVARNGAVVATHVLQGPRLLRGAAKDAVRQWRYRPYVVNGRPTDVATIVTIDFRLHS